MTINVFFDVSAYELTEVAFRKSDSAISTISNIEVTLMNGEEVTLNENIPLDCFNNIDLTFSFKLPANLEGDRFIFKFTADHVYLSKIKFFGRVKGAPQQDGTDSPDAGGDNQSETDEQNQPFVSDLIKPTTWIVKANTCWGLETTDDKHYHYSSDSCGQPEHVGLGQDANRSYHYSRFHKTNMHFLIISCLLLVLGFLHLTILENNHTRPCCLKVCDNCYECAQLICPIVTGFVTI